MIMILNIKMNYILYKNEWTYEFDLIKRVVRCRKKGEFLSDLEKVKTAIDLYLKEQGHLYQGQVEKLNK